MKLNLKGFFTNLDGKATEIELGKVLANMLASAQKGDAVKFYDWAIKLHNEGAIEIDESDRKVLEKFIKESAASAAIKGQILKALDLAKEVKEAKEKK